MNNEKKQDGTCPTCKPSTAIEQGKSYPGMEISGNVPEARTGGVTQEKLIEDNELTYPDPDSLSQRG